MTPRPQLGALAGLLLFFAATMAAGLIGWTALMMAGAPS